MNDKEAKRKKPHGNSTAAVRQEMHGKFEQVDSRLDEITELLKSVVASKNQEQVERPNPPKPVWMRLGYETEEAWEATPETIREELVKAMNAESSESTETGTAEQSESTEYPVKAPSNFVRGDSILKGVGPYQPILYNVDNLRRSTGFDQKIREINRLIDTKTGRVVQGASVDLTQQFIKIWNRELAAANRFLWDTPANCHKAIQKTKSTGKVHTADSFNSQTRKRKFYRKPDDWGADNANYDVTNHVGKDDGLVVEIYMPKSGTGWIRVVEYTNPVNRGYING